MIIRFFQNALFGLVNTNKHHCQLFTLKNAGLFQPKFGSNMDKLKCWVKNVSYKLQLKVKVEVGLKF